MHNLLQRLVREGMLRPRIPQTVPRGAKGDLQTGAGKGGEAHQVSQMQESPRQEMQGRVDVDLQNLGRLKRGGKGEASVSSWLTDNLENDLFYRVVYRERVMASPSC